MPALHRGKYLPLLSLLAAGGFYGRTLVAFLGVSAIAYIVLWWLKAQTSRTQRWRLTCIALLLLLTVFTAGRALHWDHFRVGSSRLEVPVYYLDMWLVLRLVTLFWEVGSGAVPDLSLSRYIVWICLPFTIAGPILRYSQWPEEVRPDRSFWTRQAWWLTMGAGAVKTLAGLGLPAFQNAVVAHWPAAHLAHVMLAAFITGPLGFYFITAGYFQLMEALGQPAGFKIPESFNSPIGRENISAFWMNWNMTATSVFRDYLFYNRWGRRNYNVYFNTVLLFTLVGLWHAANAYWILWGFLHGLLFCVFLLWRQYSKSFPGLPLRGTAMSRSGARLLTYICVCACWYLP